MEYLQPLKHITQIRRNKKEVIKEIKNEKTNEKTIYEIITY